jgi:two-component system cell cycle response regulator DivK
MSELQSQDESVPPQGNGELVLVVEDNEKNARLTMAMLEAGGYLTRLAVDGNEGRDLAIALLPDLIVTDLQMPGLDGLAMTQALREHSETRHIPIVAVSAHALNEHRQRALEAGCHGFLTKPFRIRALLCEVAAALAQLATTR